MLYEGNRRDFFFDIKKEKEPKRRDIKSIETFRQKDRYRTALWRALYQKAPKGQFLITRKTHTEFTYKELFPNFLGRIFQVNGRSKRVILIFFTLFFLFIIIILEKCIKEKVIFAIICQS